MLPSYSPVFALIQIVDLRLTPSQSSHIFIALPTSAELQIPAQQEKKCTKAGDQGSIKESKEGQGTPYNPCYFHPLNYQLGNYKNNN